MAGYSRRPLAGKLGYSPDRRAVVIGVPVPYGELLGGAAPVTTLSATDPVPEGTEYLHLFTARRDELECVLAAARRALAPAGMVWVSWPKKASRLPSEVTEDLVRAVALPLGLVDVKVCAVDEVWSGLKLMIRRELR